MADRQGPQRGDDPLEYMTSGHPSPYLFESQMGMLGRMGRGGTPRRRFFARLFAALAVLPFLVGIVAGVIRMLH
ncbi:hypothetical protein KBX37_32600 [Micromonospora sp. U56]|uniref:hypothetical protein n=1 Tax=Micromonospora sp. U56 TaxID=2824900 RepID=UPI001B3656F4|nr:hypothetical protein [Micromonospora sp. U56]MBQ0897737.1 hypothetical protein [Micromonospora sp. U56]